MARHPSSILSDFKTVMSNQSSKYRMVGLASIVLWLGASDRVDAKTINALSCNSGDVQSAVNGAQNGDVVLIPAGTCTWTAQVVWTAPPNVAVIGAGNQSIVGGGDVTVVVDAIPRPPDGAAFDIT